MNEQLLINSINAKLNNNLFVDVDLRGLLSMWFGKNRFNENDIFNKLNNFSKGNGLDYLSVLQGNKMLSVRFWKIEPKELLEGLSDSLQTNEEEEERDSGTSIHK